MSETTSDANGVYSLAYAPPPAPSTNLEVRALDLHEKEVTVSGVIYKITQENWGSGNKVLRYARSDEAIVKT